jgi:hypothetical protein
MIGGKEPTGTFLGLPSDWRRPTLRQAQGRLRAGIKERWWNPADRRVFTPKTFGWGYDLNLHELGRRLRLVGRG